jgi:hypothetical protein
MGLIRSASVALLVALFGCARAEEPNEGVASAASTDRITVQLYLSDHCTDGLIATIHEATNCSDLGFGTVYGVKVGSTCYDIVDTSILSACTAFRAASSPDAITIHRSDTCAGELVAFAGEGTDCSSLGTAAAYGISYHGKCYDIADTSASQACTQYASGGPSGVVLYRSDRCTSDLVGIVGPTTNCTAYGRAVSGAVYGVSIEGVCTDIADTDTASACTRYGGGGTTTTSDGVGVFDNDTCAGSPFASLRPTSDCAELASHTASVARAVRIAGTCVNIRDTTLADACNRYRDVDP